MTVLSFAQTSTNFGGYCFMNLAGRSTQKLSEAAITLPVADNKILYSK